MNLNKYYIILYFFLNLCLCSEIKNKTESVIKQSFPDFISIDWSMYQIDKTLIKSTQNTVKQKFFRKELNTWVIIDSDSSTYYGILDNVKGKSMPITFLVIFNEKGNLHDSSIIKYREAYGGEVGNRSWLDQFKAFNDTSNYKIGDEINAISGATISVHSVTKGIRKLSIIVHEIIKDYNDK